MTTTTTARRAGLLFTLAITPLLRWAIAAHSVPDDQPWRTACSCGRPLWASTAAPTGRCTGCGHRLGAPPYTVEAATVLAAVALALTGQSGWTLAAYAWWTATMVVLVFVDLAAMLLPLRISITSAVGFLGLLAAAEDHHAWRRAAIAAVTLAVLLAVLAVLARGQLGWGDVAVAVPLAAALGWNSWHAVYAGMLLGFGSAALAAITLRKIGRLPRGAALPLGPFLIGAALTVVLWP
jgi:leader peptidase (prepilin peptidase)/N-methyltransferase